jgi:hypothetical protein
VNYDLDHLKSTGLSEEKLKATFEKKWATREKVEGSADWRVNRLIDLHANRIDDGVRRSLARARISYAVEKAYDAPRDQISFTLVRDLISRNVGGDELQNIAKGWGLDQMLVPCTNDSGEALDVKGIRMTEQNAGRPGYKLHLPTFYNVLLPMVMAYVKMRWAKLFSDRDQYPLLKYEPSKMSSKDLSLCRVITSRIQRMATDMGYKDDMRQSILSMLLHGFCINFPLESYYREEQHIKGKDKVVKEGVRWFRPHPTKVFYDQAYPLHTINSDTGCEYLGYWSLRRWGEIHDNKKLWNQKQVGINDKGWRGDNLWKFYQEVYPCAMQFPAFSTGNDNDREKKAFLYSTSNDRDAAVDLTVMFHKLIPKDWGLGDYDKPVWMRFVYAGDRTCIFAEPMAYVPAVAYMYDFDENRENNSSLALELIPFQDHLGHLISQYLLTVKKNLIRIVAVDKDIVDQDFFKRMSNGAENALRGIEFMQYSGKQLRKGQQDVSQAFQTLQMNPQNATELIGAINTVLGILERVLGFSAQEVGSAATHQQSATETSIIASNTSVRMGFTSSGIDSAIQAWKKALYQAFIAYGSDDVAVQVAELTPKGVEALKAAGLELEEGENATYGVTGSKDALMIEEFSSDRDGSNRINEPQAAQLMLTLVDRLMVPQFLEAVGIDSVLELLRGVADQFGVPSDFIARIKATVKPAGGNPEEQAAQQQQFVETVKQIVQQELVPFSEQIKSSVVDPLGQTMQQTEVMSQALGAVAQAQQQDNAVIGQIAAAIERLVAGAIPQPGAPMGTPIPTPADNRMVEQPPQMV